jgi:hypothetical protein
VVSTLPDGLEVPDDCPVPPLPGPPPPTPRAAWILAGAALAARGAALLLNPVPPRDGVALAEGVRAILDGRWGDFAAAPHAPLAPLLAALPAALGLDPALALGLVAALCGAAAVLPLHAITRRIFDLDAANAAAVLLAVTPPLVRIGSTALSESPYLLLALLSVDAAHRALRHWRPARDAALAGLFAGAARLARPEGLLLLPLALLAPLPPGGGRPWRSRIAGLLLALAAFAVAAAPGAMARGRIEAAPGKDAAVLLGRAPPADPGGAAPAERHGPLAAALQAAGALPEALHPAVALLAVLGLGAAAGRKACGRLLAPALLQGAAALLLLGGVVLLEWRYGYGGRRHASGAAAMLLPFAGAGLLAAGRIVQRLRPAARPVLVHGLLLLLAAGPLLAGALLQRDPSGVAARELGRRIRALADPGARPRVATFGEPRVAWYAGGEDVRLLGEFGIRPGAAPADAARRADALRWRLQGAERPDWIVLEEGDARVPAGLAGPATPPPDATAGRLRAWRTAAFR